MTISMALFIFSAQLLAYTVKGLIGFGNPLISAPILSMGLDNVVITPGTLLLDCPVNAWITWKNRRSFQWRRILPLLAANFCGVIPGTLLLRFSMPWIIKTVLGVIVVFLGLEMATRSLRPVKPDRKDRPWLRLVVSAFSGVCAGLFGINMFIVAYLQRTAKDYSEFKGSMCFLFFGENAVRVVTYLVTGLFTGPVLLFALVSVPAAVLAMALAARLGPRLEEGKLQKGAIVLFLLGGDSLVLNVISMVLFGVAIGVLICFLGGLMAVDIVPRNATGAALGVVGMASYIAAGLQDVISGTLIENFKTVSGDVVTYDFLPVSIFWIGASILSFVLALFVWNVKPAE